MNLRRFGKTGIKLSEVTFGTMRYVKGVFESGDETEGKRTLEEALASGINTIHSSYEYRTRWATGAVLKNHPKRLDVHHIIKVPVPDFEDSSFDEATFCRFALFCRLPTAITPVLISFAAFTFLTKRFGPRLILRRE